MPGRAEGWFAVVAAEQEGEAIQALQGGAGLPRHEIAHVSEIRWKGKKDRPLLRDAQQTGFDVFITRDHNQLSDPQECRTIKDSGLHHVRFSQRREGLAGLASALGSSSRPCRQ